LRVLAALYYESPVREVLLRLKFGRDASLAAALGALTARVYTMCTGMFPEPPDAVVAVPLHPARQRARGFNQAGLIAAEVARLLHISDRADALVRVRATRRQSDVSSRAERDANLRGAIRVVDPLAFRGHVVLLLDDVLTTGATLAACTEAVVRFRPKALQGLVVASGRPSAGRIESIVTEP
jgi:ComF family protein